MPEKSVKHVALLSVFVCAVHLWNNLMEFSCVPHTKCGFLPQQAHFVTPKLNKILKCFFEFVKLDTSISSRKNSTVESAFSRDILKSRVINFRFYEKLKFTVVFKSLQKIFWRSKRFPISRDVELFQHFSWKIV